MSKKSHPSLLMAAAAMVSACLLAACGAEGPKSDVDDFADHHAARPKNGDVELVCLAPSEARTTRVVTAPVQQITEDCVVKTTGEVLANSNLLTHVTAPITGRIIEV